MKREAFIVFLVFSFLAILETFPLLPSMSLGLAGDGWDASLFVWDLWWFKTAVLDFHQSPYFCPLLLYPLGVDLLLHTLVPFFGLLYTLMSFFFSPLEFYNILVFLSFPFSGFFMYLLCRELGLNKFPSFFGGFAFMMAPMRVARCLGHLNLSSIFWYPLIVLFFMRWYREKGIRDLFYFVLSFLFLFFTSYQLFVVFLFIFPFIVLLVLVDKSAENIDIIKRPSRRPDTLRFRLFHWSLVLLLSGMALLLLFFFISAFFDYRAAGSFNSYVFGRTERYRTDVLYYFSPVYGSYFADVLHHISPRLCSGNIEETLSPGLSLWFTLVGSVLLFRRLIFKNSYIVLLIGALFLFVLSLGSSLTVAGTDSRFPLPFLLFRYVPLLNGLNIANRFAFGFLFFAAIIGAIFLHSLHKKNVVSIVAVMSIFSLSLTETLSVPFPLQKIDFTQIAMATEAGPVLTIPFGFDGSYHSFGNKISRYQMLQQTFHNQAMLSGHVSRLPLETLHYFERNPFLQQILLLQNQNAVVDFVPEQMPEIAEWFSFTGIREMYLFPFFLNEANMPSILNVLKLNLPVDSIAMEEKLWKITLPDISPITGRASLTTGKASPYFRGLYSFESESRNPLFFNHFELIAPSALSPYTKVRLKMKCSDSEESGETWLIKARNGQQQTIQLSAKWQWYEFPLPSRGTARRSPVLTFSRIPSDQSNETALSSFHISVFSGGYGYNNHGGFSSILINGKEYSPNKRGINFVSFDSERNEVLSVRNFDTCASLTASKEFAEEVNHLSSNTVLIISVRDDASSALEEKAIEVLQKRGLTFLQKKDFRWAYALILLPEGDSFRIIESADPIATQISTDTEGIQISELEWSRE